MPEIIADGLWRRIIIYNAGTDIYYLNLTARRPQPVLIRNDYMSELVTEVCDNEIIYSYINSKNEMIYGVVGGGAPLIALSDAAGVKNPRKLSACMTEGRLFIFYISDNPVNGRSLLKYFSAEDIHEHKSLKEISGSVLKYDIFGFMGEKYIAVYETDGSGADIFKLRYDREGDMLQADEVKIVSGYTLERYQEELRKEQAEKERLQDTVKDFEVLKETVKDYEALKETVKDYDVLKENAENCEKEIGEWKRTVREQKEKISEYEKNLENAKKQYDELSLLTKRIQDEGKRWRSLYQQVDISTKKTI